MDQQLKQHTFVFERLCNAGKERVFNAMADPVQRASWSTPSESAAFIYDSADFREGGQDVFRCGSRDNPQYTGTATYISIVPNARIVWCEVVKSAGHILAALLITTSLEDHDEGTRVRMAVQITSFCGDAMVQGTETGTNASLDNLVRLLSQ